VCVCMCVKEWNDKCGVQVFYLFPQVRIKYFRPGEYQFMKWLDKHVVELALRGKHFFIRRN